MKRMYDIEESNAYLKKNIERTNDENSQKMTRIAKLSEEKDELLAAREKWKKGWLTMKHLINRCNRIMECLNIVMPIN